MSQKFACTQLKFESEHGNLNFLSTTYNLNTMDNDFLEKLFN